jgi:hypothetical protein
MSDPDKPRICTKTRVEDFDPEELVEYEIQLGIKNNRLPWTFELDKLAMDDIKHVLSLTPDFKERVIICINFLSGYHYGVRAALEDEKG